MRRRMLSLALTLLLWLIGKRLIDPILQQIIFVFYEVSVSLSAISLPKGLR